MDRGLDHVRAGLMVVALAALATACSSTGSGSADDRVLRLALSLETPPPDPKPNLTVTVDGYEPRTISLGPPLIWHANDPRSIDLDLLLPGLGAGNTVTLMLSVDMNPPLFGGVDNKLPDPTTPLVITLSVIKARLDGGAGGLDGGGLDADGSGGSTGGSTGGSAGSAGSDGGGTVPPVDGGAGADAGADANDSGPGGVECDDGGVDHGTTTTIPTCTEYCSVLTDHCGPPVSDNCANICTGLHWDNIPIPAQSTAQNNLRCRIDQANQAQLSNPDDGAVFCAAAVWNGMDSGGCGTPCAAYCDAGRTNCASDPAFADPTTCLTACRLFSRANLNCRVDALVQAGLGITVGDNCTSASQGTGCPP
jgi:hypothetical protein